MMKRWLAFSFALAVLGPACSGSGGPASFPLDPFGVEPAPADGTEPSGSDNEAPVPGGASGSLEELCVKACANIQASCPGSESGANCARDCASTNITGCESQYRAFVACVGTATLTCSAGGDLNPGACQTVLTAAVTCLQSMQQRGGSSPPPSV
jgi:hypothetical protein